MSRPLMRQSSAMAGASWYHTRIVIANRTELARTTNLPIIRHIHVSIAPPPRLLCDYFWDRIGCIRECMLDIIRLICYVCVWNRTGNSAWYFQYRKGHMWSVYEIVWGTYILECDRLQCRPPPTATANWSCKLQTPWYYSKCTLCVGLIKDKNTPGIFF